MRRKLMFLAKINIHLNVLLFSAEGSPKAIQKECSTGLSLSVVQKFNQLLYRAGSC